MTEFRNPGQTQTRTPDPHLPVVVGNPGDSGMPFGLMIVGPLLGFVLSAILLAFSLHHASAPSAQSQGQTPQVAAQAQGQDRPAAPAPAPQQTTGAGAAR